MPDSFTFSQERPYIQQGKFGMLIKKHVKFETTQYKLKASCDLQLFQVGVKRRTLYLSINGKLSKLKIVVSHYYWPTRVLLVYLVNLAHCHFFISPSKLVFT